MGNSYRQVLAAIGVARTESMEGESNWTCTYRVLPGEKRVFRDIVVVSKGHFFAADPEGLPEEMKGKVKGNQRGKFVITRVFVYSDDKKEYQEQRPAKVVVQRQ